MNAVANFVLSHCHIIVKPITVMFGMNELTEVMSNPPYRKEEGDEE